MKLNREQRRERLKLIRKKNDKELGEYLNFLANLWYRKGAKHVIDAVDVEIGLGPVRKARIEAAWERQLEYDQYADTEIDYETMERKHNPLQVVETAEVRR